MFDNPYDYEYEIVNDAWVLAELDLPDDSVFRMHFIKKPLEDNTYFIGQENVEWEFIFDRGPRDSKDRQLDVFPNDMGDAFRIYSTVYHFTSAFVDYVKPDCLCWGTGGTKKTERIYEALGRKWRKDDRCKDHPMSLVKREAMVGNAIMVIRDDLL